MTERQRLIVAGLLVALLAAACWAASSSSVQEGGEIEAAEAAVRAWGEFATTGDIESVAGLFAADGPQYAQFVAEAKNMSLTGAYDFVLTDAFLVSPGVVRGLVKTATPVGELQNYQWDIEMVDQANHWRVWTVRTTSPEEPRT